MPFYLFHPRLVRLEIELMGEAEGSHSSACMRLMRHEMGHDLGLAAFVLGQADLARVL